MKRALYLLLGGALTLGGGCYTPEKIDSEHKLVEVSVEHNNLEKIINATYKLRQDSVYSETFLDKNNNVLGVKYQRTVTFGSAFAFGRDNDKVYFATAEHCLPREPTEKEQIYFDGFVRKRSALFKTQLMLVNYTKEKEEVIGVLKEVARDEDADCAILEGVEMPMKKFDIYSSFTDPSSLKLGQFIYSVGFPHGNGFSWGRHVTHGIISSFDVAQLPFKSKGTIFTEAVLDPGMSGGPTCIIENEKLLIAGVNVRLYPTLHSKFGVSLGLLDLIKKNKLEHLINKGKK